MYHKIRYYSSGFGKKLIDGLCPNGVSYRESSYGRGISFAQMYPIDL
jgi:hypothetical protein